MKTCVINFAKGRWYPHGQYRLVRSLIETHFDGEILVFGEEKDLPGCPNHRDAPYAFKPFALKTVFERGYEVVLWADASVWAIQNVRPLVEEILRRGWMFIHNTCAGEWTSDACLAQLGVSRDEAMRIPMLMGLCMGWDMSNRKCQIFLKEWLEKATDKVSFPGSWTNKNREVSADPRVRGHRHDQSVASFLAHRHGMEYTPNDQAFFQYYANPQRTLFNGDLSLIRPEVVMIGQGM
jgi:hypothetical protein